PIVVKYVISVDPNHLALGGVFDGANVDPTTDIITFPSAHDLQTGDMVEYEPGGSPTVAGLTAGGIYKVLVLDGMHIKLQAPSGKDPFGNDYTAAPFTPPSSGNTITLNSNGLQNGEAVTYHAPQPKTFSSVQVDVDGSTINGAATLNDANNNYIQ